MEDEYVTLVKEKAEQAVQSINQIINPNRILCTKIQHALKLIYPN